ncbi:MAG: hypothetical protein ACPL3S_03305 [Halothiobacillaceae bacterium]|jgi:hypothetical protein
MSEHKRVFGKTFAELDAQAKEAARRAVADLHAHGIPTYHMEGGKIIETAPGASWTRRRRMGQGMSPHGRRQS